MAKQTTKKSGDVFTLHKQFIKDINSCGIKAPAELPTEVRRKMNVGGEVKVAGGTAKVFTGDVELITESKIVMRKVKRTVVDIEQNSKKAKNDKVKKFFQSLLKKKEKEDKKKVIEIEEPNVVVDARLSASLNGKSYHLLGFSCDTTEAQKMIDKGLAKQP